MSRLADIEFTLSSGDKQLNFALSPLKQREAGRVFHTSVMQIVRAFSEIEGFKDESKIIKGLAKGLSSVDYDLVWDLAETLCKGALVNEKDLGDLEDFEPLGETPWLLYLIVFNGIKGNWPKVFSGIEARLGGFVSRAKTEMAARMGITAD